MNKYLIILIFIFTAGKLRAQQHKITIYASFDRLNCQEVHYSNYDKLYPDSIKAAVMIDYPKKYQLSRQNTGILLLRMNLDGWKLVAVINRDGGIKYLLSKEILLDDAALNCYTQNLKNLKNDKNDVLSF